MLIVLCLVLNFVPVLKSNADDSSESEIIEAQLRKMESFLEKKMLFYRNMAVCGEFEANITAYNGSHYKIYGIENDKCHIETNSYHCYFPEGVYQKFANKKIDEIGKMLSDLKHRELRHKNLFMPPTQTELQELLQFTSQYCKL